MNEFEWRQQMRGLRQQLTPQRDLWDAIDAALDDAEPLPAATVPARQPSYVGRWLIAASVAAAFLLAGGIGWHLQHTSASAPVASAQTGSTPSVPNTPTIPAAWKPDDPRFAGAAIELDAARMELQQAMQQAPHSPALQRLLDRTEHQQTQLRQLVHEAG